MLWMRLPRPEIVDTEKPMDLGILATLLRARALPPPDMWLAGERLPYYAAGAAAWVPLLRAAAVPLAVGYNLIAAAMGGLVAGAAWALGRELAGPARAGWAAAALVAFAGTPDGLRQALAGTGIDLWASSRRVAHCITEFPLFSLWLGDLHPHLLTMPLQLVVWLAALAVARRGPRPAAAAGVGALAGFVWSANPWAMPPALAGAAALLVGAAPGGFRWPWEEGGAGQWLAAGVMGAAAAVAAAPFLLTFHPPFSGLGVVRAWTRPPELLLWGGAVLLPAAAVAWRRLRVAAGPGERGLAVTLAVAALGTVAAGASARAVAVGLVLVLVPLLEVAAGGEERIRAAAWLAALGVFLLLVPEILHVRDPYGGELHRMNTVFKAYIQAWPALAVAAPGLLAALGRRARWAVAAALLVASAPQAVWALAQPLGQRGRWGLDGLRFLVPGDRAAVAVLEGLPPGAALVEAVGPAYSRYARLSAASGVPALLGWANHERVWRGETVGPELERRERLVRTIYTVGDPAAVRRLARAGGVTVIAVGPLERETYPGPGLRAVLASGPHLLEGETVLVEVPR